MTTQTTVIVLRDDVRLDSVLAYADADGWALRQETSRTHLVRASRRWSALVGEEIEYVADHIGGSHWLKVTGAETLARRLRDRFGHHTEQELLDVVLGTNPPDPVQCVRVASKLAACRPADVEARHLAALERMFGHPVTAVRRAAIRSAYTCPWPELREMVEQRRKVEKHLAPQLEHLAQYLAE